MTGYGIIRFYTKAIPILYENSVLLSYKLEGFDRDWIETDYQHRRVTYTDLPDGEYIFKVKASNDDGYWNEEGASVKIKILPPPWKTWWAYSLYTLSVLGLLYWFVQSQRNKLKQKQRELEREKQVTAHLVQLDKLKDEFLANTSHELRTPLNGIIGIAESLIDGMDAWSTEQAQENLKLIISSGKRLASLVDDILDFSKMKHHTMELSTKPVDLRALVDVILATSKTLVGDKDLKLVNEVGADLPSVDADENRLYQIMYNLVGNAIKFTQAGSVNVSATAQEKQLEIRVTDTGIGIPKDKFDRIFESFEQADGSTTRTYGGTGLGLAVTKQLIELHGGQIHVQSMKDRGSIFTFTLPVASQRAQLEQADVCTVSKVRLSEPSSAVSVEETPEMGEVGTIEGEFSILIVDDDPVNLQVLTNHLSMQNYKITQASSGPQALKMIDGGERFDLILVDIMMPLMSGYEVTEILRSRYAAHELPVIFLTAKNQLDDLIAGFAAGGSDYLTKPVSKAELLARVKTHLELLDINRNLEQKVKERTAQLRESLEQLKKAQRQLAEASHRAGMAEVASSVLHNVGNALNSVNVSANIILDTFKHQRATRLQDVAELICQHESDLADFFSKDPKGRKIPLYIRELADKWVAEQKSGMEETSRLQTNIGSVVGIVSAQQEYANATGVLEAVSMETLINTAIDMSELVSEKDQIQIIRSFEDLPPVMLEAHKVVQILINILNNASQALKTIPKEEKRLTLGIERKDEQRIRISVIDNGVGIQPENLTAVFAHGFTTKEGGRGYGLHVAANAATEMGGALTCHSDGAGAGAAFYLEIPFKPKNTEEQTW